MRSRIIVGVVAVLFVVSCLGCGLIMHGAPPPERRGNIDIFAVVGDLFWFGGIGLIIDAAAGGLYLPLPQSSDSDGDRGGEVRRASDKFCPNCGRGVSARAVACPQCGGPIAP